MSDLETPKFSSALALVIACARWPLDAAGEAEIRRHAAAETDWERVLAWVNRHGVAPLVHRNLRQAASGWKSLGVPETTLRRLHDQATRNARRAMMQLAEGARVTRILADAGIRSMIIKGPVLSHLAFGDLTLRESRDIDLLIDPEHVQEADRLIGQAGYCRFSPDFPLTPHQYDEYRRMRCQFAYHSERLGVVQELHWRLSTNSTLLPLDETVLWSRAEPVRLGAMSFATLPDDELFLYLCVHGSAHVWFRLKWLADIAALLRRLPPAAIERIGEHARLLEVDRPFHQALILAHSLMAAPVPAAILAGAARDKTVRRMATAACRALNWRELPAEPSETLWFNAWVSRQAYRLKPGFRYRWAELQGQMSSPEDWARVKLPERLFFLYLPLRPFSWVTRKLQHLVRW
jgi:putative nucleotidyltransferase-like protein